MGYKLWENAHTGEVEEIRSLVSALAQLKEGGTSDVLLLAQGFLALQDGSLLLAQESLQKGVAAKPAVFCGCFYLASVLYQLHRTSDCIHTCQDGVSISEPFDDVSIVRGVARCEYLRNRLMMLALCVVWQGVSISEPFDDVSVVRGVARSLSLLSSKTGHVIVNTAEAVKRLHLMMAQCCHLQGTKQSLSQALSILEEVHEVSDEVLSLRASLLLGLGEMEKFQECLETLGSKDTTEVRFLQAQLDFCNKNYTSAVSKLRECVSEDTKNAQYLLKLGQALWELHHHGNGAQVQEECFNSLLKAAKLDPYLSDTFLYLGHFYAEVKRDQERAKKCYQKAFDLDSNSDEAGAALCDMLTALGEEDSVQSLLERVTGAASAGCAKWAWLRLGLAQVRSGDPSTAITSLQSALRADPEDRHAWECLAEAYLHRGSFTAALKAFGRAAELQPDSMYCLYQMANIKQRVGVLSEAVKEYKLILDQSPNYVPALKGLGETQLLLAQRHLQQHLIDLAHDHCQQAIHWLTKAAAQRSDLSCLWKLLGDCCTLLRPLPTQSVSVCVAKRLCQTTTHDNTDTVCVAKRLCQTTTRDNTDTVCVPKRLCQTATRDNTDTRLCQTTTRDNTDTVCVAKRLCQTTTRDNTDTVCVAKRLCQTTTRDNTDTVCVAKRLCQTTTRDNTDTVCVPKRLCLTTTRDNTDTVCVAKRLVCVPKRLCQTTTRDNTDTVKLGKVDLLQLGARCYGRALKILPNSAPLWHDLGISYLQQTRESSCSDERTVLMDKCLYALKKAVSLDPGNHMHWTALGVAATSPYVKNLPLAQHCFIKSIQSETNNAVAWTNLGTLYLQNDNIQLAHRAFNMAQSQDPEYVAGWVGQALIAELVGHGEAMDLFRHTTQIGIHLESCIGYGHWVISTLLDVTRQDTPAFQYCIHQMAAIPAACDALTRYTSLVKTEPAAFNMLGLLLEHQGLDKPALAAAISYHRKNNRYKEASAVFESCGAGTMFADLCQWGLVLYQAGRLPDSFTVYQQALALAESEANTSHVWSALGMVAYKLGDMEGAKSALFQGYQSSSPSLHGLFALCALGLLQGDATLTQATIQELSNLVKKGERITDVATLMAALKVSQGEVEEAVTAVQQMLHNHTEVVGLWLLLARLSLQYQKDSLAAETCAKGALGCTHLNDQASLVCLALSQLHLGKHSRRAGRDNAVRAAQKAFHVKPDDVGALCCLVSAVHGEAVIRYITSGDRVLLSREVSLLNQALGSPGVSTAQRCWCLKQRAVTQILCENTDGAGQTLQQEQQFVQVLSCVLKKDLTGLEPLVIGDGTDYFFWQVLVVGLIRNEQWTEAGVVLREALQKATGDSSQQVKTACLFLIAWMAAHQLLKSGGDPSESGDNSPLLAELQEATQALDQLSERPHTVTQLFLALVHFHNNPRKAKHHFANVLDPALPSSSLGVDLSMARRGKLLSEADESVDTATASFYNKLQNQ
ncbi:hypothetical protein BaRGS_00035177 [Batillaria attramentaria]|uniref:Tetratricopeptide repeat protein 37 n=1 Tax=Batillaria attramentaria TaxID=370345 RepID=A0ABD0JEU7_9CAEN